jgi:hypothetical protein
MSTLIKLRRDTAANWASADPVLQLGEPGYDTTNNQLRIGDGTTPWSELTPIAGGGAANIGNWVFDGNDATVDNDGYPHLYGGPDGGPEFTYLEEAGNTGSYSQTMYINGEDGFFVSLDYGNAQFAFNTNGTTIFPTLEVDLHNGGVQTGQVLQFGDAGQQAIITGPTPAANINAQRLIIQGQRGNGTGEGGDVYVWAGDAETNGGDIKIYAGDADNVSAGGGGYVNIAGGDGFNYGGDITLSGGYSANGYGGQISLNGGQGQTDGGLFSINGGYGTTGQGGDVQINGGISGNGAGSYGNVTLGSASSEWKFDNTGTLTFPENSGDGWPIKEQRYGMGNIGAWLDGQWTIGEFSGNGVSGTVGIRIDPAIEGPVGMTFPSSESSNTQPVQIYSTNGSGIGLYTGVNNWAFNADGNLTLPGNTILQGDGGGIEYPVNGEWDLHRADGLVYIGSVTDMAYIDTYSANIGVRLRTNGENQNDWIFDPTGNLTLPDISSPSINYANGQPYGGSSSAAGNAGDIQINVAGGLGADSTLRYVDNGGEMTLYADYLNAPGIFTSDIYAGDGTPSNITLTTNYGNATWTFDTDGNLTLPSNTASINYANGDPFSGGPVNTGNVTFDDNVVIGTGDQYGGSGLYLAPGADSPGNLQYLRVRGGDYVTHIHLDTGNNVFFDQYFGDDNKYVKLEATGNIVISADDDVGNTAQWTFDTTGNLEIPANGAIETPPGSNGNIFIHPDGNGRVVIQGGASTLLTLSSDLPNTQNRFEIDTYGANLGNLGGGVFTGTYLRLGSPTQVNDRLASFAGKGTEDGASIQLPTAARITIDAAGNWSAGNAPSHISFWTTAIGANVATETVRIAPGGNVILYNGNLVLNGGNITGANILTAGSVVITPTALANLTAVAGARAFVNDGNLIAAGNFGSQVSGGAGNTVPVWSDGTNWYIG